MRESYNIQNTDALIEFGGKLDSAIEKPVFYGEDRTETLSYKGIYNESQNELAQITSDRYTVIQHRDVVHALISGFKNKGIEVFGRLDNYGNQFRADLVFGNQKSPITDGSKGGIKLGIRAVNSYNRSTSFRLEMFGFRMICQNGMSLGKVMNDIKEVTFHTGKEKNLEIIQAIVDGFIDKVIDNSTALQMYVSKSMEDSVAWLEITKILEKYLPHQKHRDKICEKLGITMIKKIDEKTKKKTYEYVLEKTGKEIINRWDFYNVITSYATHNKFSVGTENFIQEVAQKALKNNFESLIPVEVVENGN